MKTKSTHKLNFAALAWLACSSILFAGCSESPNASKFTQQGKVKNEPVVEETKKILDPTKARVSVSAISKSKASEGSSYMAPSFTLGLVDADYVEILRCDSSFKPKVTTGKLVKDVIASNDPTRSELLEFAFNNMKGQISYCRAVSLSAAQNFVDISAPQGSFYYVVNPCVNAERSSNKQRSCSSELVLTDEYTNTTTLSQEALKVAGELAAYEGQLYAGFTKMQSYAQIIKDEQETCEVNWIHKELAKSFWRGITKIGAAIAGAAANTFLAGSGVVVSKIINYVGGTMIGPPESTPNCPQMPAHIDNFQKAAGRIEELTKGVVEKRNKMSVYNSQFEKIDEKILELFKNPQPEADAAGGAP
jgi:hypothetical protein